MKNIILILTTLIFYKPILGQTITPQDSSDCKFYQGRLSRAIALSDSATYIYNKSKRNPFIEFSTVTWGSLTTKYRVEKLSYDIFTVTKTVANRYDSTSTCFIAIDSNLFNEIKIRKRDFKNFKNRNVYKEITKEDALLLNYFSGFITQHNLQYIYTNFKPNLFVAWFKIKSKSRFDLN